MEKPEDIAQDVWDRADAAFEVGAAVGASAQEIIARAILSAVEDENEACARAVHALPDANDDVRGPLYATGWTSGIRTAEQAIRNRRNRKGV